MELITFQQAIDEANIMRTRANNPVKKHLLLGNGFSIALQPNIFTYQSLFNKADFSEFPHIIDLFSMLETTDFEKVIESLEQASAVIAHYAEDGQSLSSTMKNDAQKIKEILVETIAGNHPERPNDIQPNQYESCGAFLSHFLNSGGEIYTLNYDILLYWVLMEQDLISDDGFRTDPDEPEADYVYWSDDESHSQRVFYVHGALHLFDAGHQLRKYTWIRTDIPLIEQTREAISHDSFPLFVSEGSWHKKLSTIAHSGYLHRSYKRLTDINGCLFIHGWSFADNDNHIIKKIEKSKFNKIYIGLFGDINSETNKEIIQKSIHISETNGRHPDIAFYDSSTARVWG